MSAITVIGGSSPFTVGLIEALQKSYPPISPGKIVLHGRTKEDLELVGSFGSAVLRKLGWQVEWSADIARALEGAEFVIHQARYGGLESREKDEKVARALGLPPDETLGPSGLQAAIRTVEPVLQLSKELRRFCPEAWVLNLTNPLSVSTAIFSIAGVKRCVGICELPKVTHRQIAQRLHVSPSDVKWDYIGFNHRGFVHNLRLNGDDVLGKLIETLADGNIGGCRPTEIAELQGVPLKYFQLFRGSGVSKYGRALRLIEIRREILNQLKQVPDKVPDAIKMRNMPWYQEAVVPLIRSLCNEVPEAHIVNWQQDGEEIVREIPAQVSSKGIQPMVGVCPSERISSWVRRFEKHEKLSVLAALDPSFDRIEEALEADPLVAPTQVRKATQIINANV